MRRVVVSKTFERDLQALLAQGADLFGDAVAQEKRKLITTVLRTVLAKSRKVGTRVRKLKLFRYEVTGVPLVILYNYARGAVYIHTVVHARSDIPNTDLSTVEW